MALVVQTSGLWHLEGWIVGVKRMRAWPTKSVPWMEPYKTAAWYDLPRVCATAPVVQQPVCSSEQINCFVHALKDNSQLQLQGKDEQVEEVRPCNV